MKKQKMQKAQRWDDYDQDEYAEQVLQKMQEHKRISQDLKRVLAKTQAADKACRLKRMQEQWEDSSFAQKEMARKNRIH